MTKLSVCVVGLGYVGLPLANALSKKGYTVFGHDISERRITELQVGKDHTGEVSSDDLQSKRMTLSIDPSVIGKADIIIVAVPTPVDAQNLPDLSPVIGASHAVGKHLKKGMIIAYESTVYPGVTEDICGPILEAESGLRCGQDFFLGYSPERINPGDKEHTVDRITKVVSGQDAKTLDILCDLYGSVTSGGVHRASSIRVAEMAKAIENAQRDINIAYINEVAMLCNKLGIATRDVLAAAKTKWNFLGFEPGLVGGHCIGVDPYYLVERARQLGMTTQVINAGRKLNDNMPLYVADQIINTLGPKARGARVLVLGLTFKENVPDTRNSKSFDVVQALERGGCTVHAHDPYANEADYARWKLTPGHWSKSQYDAIALLVPHAEYLEKGQEIVKSLSNLGIIFDIKGRNPTAFQSPTTTYLCL
jgi:UDP-N-acetyl-D-glucosamine/UDP-N-acetyl-D-galactosamine dehydrogenase